MDGYVDSCDLYIRGWVRSNPGDVKTSVEILCNGRFLMTWVAEDPRADLENAFGFCIPLALLGNDGDFIQLKSVLTHELLITHSNKSFCIIRDSAKESRPGRNFTASTRVQLDDAIQRWGWQIGEHTYGRPIILEPGQSSLVIGRFCSIAPDVTIILGNHRTDLVTSYPFKSWATHWPGAQNISILDHVDKGSVRIGHDVWLGSKCIITSGVEIGSGAVIGTGSIVTKNIPPYSIAVGSPARVVKKRFDKAIIDRLIDIGWWNWPDEEINRIMHLILSTDVESLLRYGESRAGDM